MSQNIKSNKKKTEFSTLVDIIEPTPSYNKLLDSIDNRSSFYSESIQSFDNRKDVVKPEVNLPSLDDPILSFEEYSILNNLPNNKNFIHPNDIYGDISFDSKSVATSFDLPEETFKKTPVPTKKIIRITMPPKPANSQSPKRAKSVNLAKNNFVSMQNLSNLTNNNNSRIEKPQTAKVIPIGPPPKPKIVHKESVKQAKTPIHGSVRIYRDAESILTELDEPSSFKTPDLRPRPYSTVSTSYFKNLKSKNPILKLYGPVTAADSISKLDDKQIELLRSSSFVRENRVNFPNVNISVNQMLKRVYFFGAQKQVIAAKEKFLNELDSIKLFEIRSTNNDLVDYLKKPEIKTKIIQYLKSEFKNRKENSYLFCTYEIVPLPVNRQSDQSENLICLYTNQTEALHKFNEFLAKNIKNNYKIELNSNILIESIKNEDQRWKDLYQGKYSSKLDYKLDLSVPKTNLPNKEFQKVKIDVFEINWSY